MKVNYNLIYTEMLTAQFPEKMKTVQAQNFLSRNNNSLDIINFNQFVTNENGIDKKYISYDEASLKEILKYQDENELTNEATAKLYNISRMTLRKWKKHFNQLKITN